MSDTLTNELIVFVEKMPAFPKSVHRILQLTSAVDTSAKEIVKIIESDPIMTIKILKVINSSFYGMPKKVTSTQRAVVHLGLNTIKNLALSVAAMGTLNPKNKADFNIDDFLLPSLTTASICRMLAEKLEIPHIERSDFFVAGLLHDFGKIVFAEFYPENFKLALEKSKQQNIALNKTELEFIGISHAQAGKLLATKWGLADTLINAIEHHHDRNSSNNILKDCVYTANQISKKMQFGFAGDPTIDELSDNIITHFGLPLEDLINTLGDLSVIKTEALSFINS